MPAKKYRVRLSEEERQELKGLVSGHFLRVAASEIRRAGVRVPLCVSHKAALERLGPLGAAWLRPGSFRPDCTFQSG